MLSVVLRKSCHFLILIFHILNSVQQYEQIQLNIKKQHTFMDSDWVSDPRLKNKVGLKLLQVLQKRAVDVGVDPVTHGDS